MIIVSFYVLLSCDFFRISLLNISFSPSAVWPIMEVLMPCAIELGNYLAKGYIYHMVLVEQRQVLPKAILFIILKGRN